ncbi:hypothetical protein HDU79_006683 [Rhizoclosmatium sp. JEL0117]|nr:hypothetical protein HDU79_006683 [Rhizoclosmatium sp. JEL0117]
MNGNTLNGTIPSWITGFTMLRYLDLSNNRLTGPIPPELANLKNLDYLHLEYNQLNGTIPSSLLTLPKRNFDMNCLTNAPNQNISCAPPSPFASITLPSVNYDCAIVSNAFTKMGFTRRIPSTGTQCCTWDTSYIRCNEQGFVTALNFEHSQLRGGIDVDLFGLSQLTMLNLNNNYLSQQIPTQLGALTQLQLLDLSFNQLSGGIPDVFSGMDLLAREQ